MTYLGLSAKNKRTYYVPSALESKSACHSLRSFVENVHKIRTPIRRIRSACRHSTPNQSIVLGRSLERTNSLGRSTPPAQTIPHHTNLLLAERSGSSHPADQPKNGTSLETPLPSRINKNKELQY